MRFLRSGNAIAAIALAAAACSPESPEQVSESLTSWQASVRLARQATHDGSVPARYGAQVRDRAQAALNESRATTPEKATSEEVLALAAAGRELQAAIDSLSEVVSR